MQNFNWLPITREAKAIKTKISSENTTPKYMIKVLKPPACKQHNSEPNQGGLYGQDPSQSVNSSVQNLLHKELHLLGKFYHHVEEEIEALAGDRFIRQLRKNSKIY